MEIHLAIANGLPNLAHTRKGSVERQQGPLVIQRTAEEISRVDVVRCLVPSWDWRKYGAPTRPDLRADISHRRAKGVRHGGHAQGNSSQGGSEKCAPFHTVTVANCTSVSSGLKRSIR